MSASKLRDVASSSPIASESAAEINVSQSTGVEELVTSLPATIPSIGPGTNKGSGDFATIDLRGFGLNRGLVLVNRRRMAQATFDRVVDTNVTPVALLERVDLVTGVASTVCGAGMVNFVKRRNFSSASAIAT